MQEAIILGIVQGITEWLPISSSGMLLLVQSNFFGNTSSFSESIELFLFLHLGTFFAALIYFWNEVIRLAKVAIRYTASPQPSKLLLKFMVLTTLLSGIVGFILLYIISSFEAQYSISAQLINIIIGVLLLITAFLQLSKKNHSNGHRDIADLNKEDALFLGFLQGFSAIPGISRSGITVPGLLFRNFSSEISLKLSFLMSLPIILGGNIILGTHEIAFSAEHTLGLVFSFVFGIATIHFLMKFAQKVNFGYFLLVFGILLIIASFVSV